MSGPSGTGYGDPVIGFAHALLVGLVLGPQATTPTSWPYGDGTSTARAFLDVSELPIDVAPQALSVLDVTTTPGAFEIGAAFEVQHRIDVGISVQHGDLAEANKIRNQIVLELCARCDLAAGAMMAADDPDGAQAISRVRWRVDYRPLTASDDTVAEAVIEFAIDADVNAPVVTMPAGNRLVVIHGAPTPETDWALGDVALDVDTGDVYVNEV